jgi:hypothetical protein
MGVTATRYDATKIRAGSVGQLWANVAIPGAGGRITLASDGSPESVANPTAVHLGMTKAGSTAKIGMTVTDQFADEFPDPISSSFDQIEGTIDGELIQIFDEEMLKIVTANFGSYVTAAGYKQFTFGSKPLTYPSIALIFPTMMDPTKFAVFQLYKSMNVSGFTLGAIDRKGETGTPFSFKGYGIPSRAAGDTFGTFWWQI